MTASGAVPELHVYDVAYLAGGPARVVDTAVVALVAAGRLRLRSPGSLATADLSRRHPVEAAVLDAVGPVGHRSVDTVRWRLTEDDRLLEVGRRLRRAGRRTLRAAAGRIDVADAELTQVALHRPGAMADQRRRAEIFERPSTALAPPAGIGRRSRAVDHSDPEPAAYRTGSVAASAGAFALFSDGGV